MPTTSTVADAMVDACLRLHVEAVRTGNPEIIEPARRLLYQTGTQIAGEIRAANGGGERATRH